MPPPIHAMHWFRKGLRLHDNPALLACLEQEPSKLYPVYVLDGDCYQLLRCTPLRANFLVETLYDLDQNLRRRGSRLYVLNAAQDDPATVLSQHWKKWHITHLSFEQEETGEPYAQQRDEQVLTQAAAHNLHVHVCPSETLHPLAAYVEKCKGKALPINMTGFQKLFRSLPAIPKPKEAPESLPTNHQDDTDDEEDTNNLYLPPQRLTDLPWPRNTPRSQMEYLWNAQDCHNLTPLVHGGETRALQALTTSLENANWVATFAKPETSCTSITPSTTALSPYLSWGCLSPRQVWYSIDEALARRDKNHVPKPTQPPVSLHGQLLWRDFNHLMAMDANNSTPGCWNHIQGNKHCRDIPWDDNPQLLQAWKDGRTGYPWIDACMRQLATQGWIHHLGRHAVACFLTRGDLWQSWEKGAQHFEALLLDADYALNGFNWLWLSCSGFFYQYFRCYSPISFQKKNDPHGRYIRRFVPELAQLPDKYIYEPWLAPPVVLHRAGIVLGQDYPEPIVEQHTTVSKSNISRMKLAYDQHQRRIQEQQQQHEQSSSGTKEPAKKRTKKEKNDKNL